jgi:plasmid stabilization system protein ParE
MASELVIDPDAELDLKHAVNWYNDQRQGLGDEFVECVEAVFDRILKNPDLHAIEYRSARITLVPRFPFLVVYLAKGNTIHKIAVLHGHRDPDTWRGRIS